MGAASIVGMQRLRVLVTGASGFVGSAVVRQLCEAGHDVRVLVRSNSNLKNLHGFTVELVHGDLTENDSLVSAVAGCEGLFHVAADYRLWVPQPETMYRANVGGTVNLMRFAMAAGIGRIVYTSSVATLGVSADGHPSDETFPSTIEDMIGPYKRSKFLAEQEVRRMVEDDGLAAVIVNPSTPIGAGDIRPTPTGCMIIEAAAGRMTAYVDTGLNIVHVEDVAKGHLLAFERGEVGERYILGGENMLLKQILSEISEVTGGPPPRFALPRGVVLPIACMAEIWNRVFSRVDPLITLDSVRMAKKRMFFSSGKARDKLGYTSRPAVEALNDAVSWFRLHGYCG